MLSGSSYDEIWCSKYECNWFPYLVFSEGGEMIGGSPRFHLGMEVVNNCSETMENKQLTDNTIGTLIFCNHCSSNREGLSKQRY